VGEYGTNTVYTQMSMEKKTLVESIPGIGGGGKMLKRVNSSMIYLFHCKNLC
jgi:hypothetical protein